MSPIRFGFICATAILLLVAAYTCGTAARVDTKGDGLAKLVEDTNDRH